MKPRILCPFLVILISLTLSSCYIKRDPPRVENTSTPTAIYLPTATPLAIIPEGRTP